MLGPSSSTGGQRISLNLQERWQNERVRRLGPRVEAPFQGPSATGAGSEDGLVGGGEVGKGNRLKGPDNELWETPSPKCDLEQEVKDRAVEDGAASGLCWKSL